MIRDREYLDSHHDEACMICGVRGNVVGAHIGAFKGMKRSDDETLPLCFTCHGSGHQSGEMANWREKMPDYVLRMALRALGRERYREWKKNR